MSILKFKKPDGTWESIAAIKGEPGKDGAIQYQAGEGIKIEDNVISATNSDSEEDATKFGKIFRLELEYKSMVSGFPQTIAAGTEKHNKLISTVNEAINYCINNDISSVFFMIDSPTSNNSNYLNGLIGIVNNRLNDLSISLPLYINMVQLGTMKYLGERYRLQFSVVNVNGHIICDETKDVTFIREDINFATKKYVDNQIKTAITSVLEADY